MNKPIVIRRDQRQRLYLVNLTEFDLINSFHLHANFFDYYHPGTPLTPTLRTVDTIMQCQAQRGILEFDFKGFEPGHYMFQAHQSEFAALGWTGFFGGEAGRPPAPPGGPRLPAWAAWILPLAALMAMLAFLAFGDPLAVFRSDLPPAEALRFERVDVTPARV